MPVSSSTQTQTQKQKHAAETSKALKTVRPGSSGPAVKRIQQHLTTLGFLPEGNVSGRYDEPTKAAVAKFRASRKDLDDTGAANEKLQKTLGKAANEWNHTTLVRRREIGKKGEVNAAHRLDEKTEAAAGAGIGMGQRGEVVKNVERHLRAAGYDLGKANGDFGLRTEAAVKAFQEKKGLEVTGSVDGRTWAALRENLFSATSATGPAISKGEKSAGALRVEKLLKQLGTKNVQVDGRMGGIAEKAIEKFQKKHDLKVTGAVNERTMKALEKAANDGGMSSATKKFIEVAKKQIGDPYVFGADGPNAFDCSGLIHYSLKQAGVNDVRTTARGYQERYAKNKVNRENLEPGDLIFYYYPNDRGIPPGKASHIEIYLGNGKAMGTDTPSEGARVENVDWSAFIGGARVPGLNR